MGKGSMRGWRVQVMGCRGAGVGMEGVWRGPRGRCDLDKAPITPGSRQVPGTSSFQPTCLGSGPRPD